MPGTIISGSTNLSLLDELILADLCSGKFFIDSSPTIFLGSGSANVLGIKVQVKNPSGAIIKDFGAIYDAAPGLSGGVTTPVSVNIPTKGGKFQYGVYTFALQLTDANGTQYVVTKTQNICAYPDEKSVCQDSVEMLADCQAGRLRILMSDPPTYQGRIFQSKVESWTLFYPTESGLSSFSSSVGNFDVVLFEGVYKLTGNVCVTYNMGDNIFISIGSTGKWEKNVKCVLDYSCIYPQFARLMKDVQDCNDHRRDGFVDTLFNVLALFTSINMTLGVGEDASDQIDDLEKLLGCSCTCECQVGVPISNNAPSTSMRIEGCNVTKETVGLTDVYTINNYEVLVVVDPSQSIFSISAPSLTNCVKTQTLSVSVAALYTAVKSQINSNIEYNFWASVLNNAIQNVDPANLGLTLMQWQALSFAGKVQALIDADSGAGGCDATVSAAFAPSGANVIATIAAVNAYNVDIYMDSVLRGTILAGATSFTIIGAADGSHHDVILIPRCVNNHPGVAATYGFTYLACPDITPPTLSSNNVTGASCPYDLTALVSALPAGITAEWHTANNPGIGTLVSNPAAASSGVYFVFAKNVSGCYSVGVQVTLICASTSDCSAPQNLTITRITGANKVSFESAAFPPPGNSYTVKRRRSSDPDISGSYTTIGTPAYNGTSGKWELSDTTAAVLVLYTYLAQSNCTSTSPNVQQQMAYATAETITTTPFSDHIHLSVGGSSLPTHQVQFDLLNNTGLVQLQSVTLNTGASLVQGDFLYLNPSTTYRVRIRRYLSGFLLDDLGTSVVSTTTGTNFRIEGHVSNLRIDSSSDITGIPFTSIDSTFPVDNTNFAEGIFTNFSGTVGLNIDWLASPTAANAELYLDGVLQETISVNTAGHHDFSPAAYSADQFMLIKLV